MECSKGYLSCDIVMVTPLFGVEFAQSDEGITNSPIHDFKDFDINTCYNLIYIFLMKNICHFTYHCLILI